MYLVTLNLELCTNHVTNLIILVILLASKNYNFF